MDEIQYRYYLYNKDNLDESHTAMIYQKMAHDCSKICWKFGQKEVDQSEKTCMANCMSKYIISILIMNKALLS